MKTKLYLSVFLLVVANYILPTILNAQTISAGGVHALTICNDNTERAWGNNVYGQLGDGTNTSSNSPVPVSSLTGITAIAGEYAHSLALKNDSTVRAWGWNSYGQLGNGINTNSNIPVQVSSLTGIIAIAGGWYHSLSIKNDSTVWAWGRNLYGQLGNGSNTDSNIPVQVSSLAGITAIATGGRQHSLALKNSGTVWSWGNNLNGQLGNGTNTDSNIPVQVSSITGITAIAAGYDHSLALKNDSTVWTWGFNLYGQLGNGTNTNSNIPVQVNSLTGITAIAGGGGASGNHSLALKNDGTVWAWGNNGFGQLGNSTNTDSNVPVQVSSLTGITAISGGNYYSIALKNDGTVWAWGRNNVGQLGDGTTTDSNVPVLVNGLCTALTTAVNEITEQPSVSIFPNPFNSFTTIQLSTTIKNADLNIYNLYGQNIKTIKNISEQTVTLFRDNLASGLYFVQLTQDGKTFSVDKFVIVDE